MEGLIFLLKQNYLFSYVYGVIICLVFFFFFLQDRISTLGIETTIGRTCKIKFQG